MRIRHRLLAAGAVLTASLLSGSLHPFGAVAAETRPAPPLLEHADVPPDVRAMLTTKCADCHSMQTRLPLYDRFAPASWLVERDILKGRQAMNLSQWDSYSVDKQEDLKAEMVEQVREHKMPLVQYRAIHWSAWTNDGELKGLRAWAHVEGQSSAAADTVTQPGDAVAGKQLFERRCTGCHAVDREREGPHLGGVYGRVAGTVAGYEYSTGVRDSHMTWNEATLERWLSGPDEFISGANMDFSVPNPQDRRNIIEYLKTLSATK